MRQMHRAGIAQLPIMALANMTGGAQADRRHSRRDGRLDPACAVFDDEALIRAYVELAGGKQKDVGMRFSAGDHIGTENMAAEFRLQCQHRKAQLQTVDRTG